MNAATCRKAVSHLSPDIYKPVVFVLEDCRKPTIADCVVRTSNLLVFEIENDCKIVWLSSVALFEHMKCPCGRPKTVYSSDRQRGTVIDRDLRVKSFRFRKGGIECEGILDNLPLRYDLDLVPTVAKKRRNQLYLDSVRHAAVEYNRAPLQQRRPLIGRYVRYSHLLEGSPNPGWCDFSGYNEFSLLAVEILLFYPLVGMPKADVKTSVRLPPEDLFDECIVTVATAHAAWSSKVILPCQIDSCDSFDLGYQFINRNQFTGPEIDRRRN